MKNPDIILTDMDNEVIRITFVSDKAKKLTVDESEFAPYVTRDKDFVFINIKKTVVNKNNMIGYCISHNLKMKIE